jgi:peptide/nickel transport system permease protein
MAIVVAPVPTSERQAARRERLRLLVRKPAFIVGLLVIVVWVTFAILGTHITPHDPFNDYSKGDLPPGSPDHLLGTDRLGRDVLSRLMAGSRDVLIIAPLAALIGVVGGTTMGLAMGYFRGLLDDVLSRVVEAFMALPVIMVALLTLVVLGSSNGIVILVVGVLFAPIVARTVRSAVLAERELDYVTSARLRGEGAPFIMVREILPNITAPIIVELTVRIGYAIFTVATLSFLGVGIQPPSADWGLAISESYNTILGGQWWSTIFPALAIASLVIAVNLVADSLQSVLDQ